MKWFFSSKNPILSCSWKTFFPFNWWPVWFNIINHIIYIEHFRTLVIYTRTLTKRIKAANHLTEVAKVHCCECICHEVVKDWLISLTTLWLRLQWVLACVRPHIQCDGHVVVLPVPDHCMTAAGLVTAWLSSWLWGCSGGEEGGSWLLSHAAS